jgi:uncharacterized protein (TIGR00255 family)
MIRSMTGYGEAEAGAPAGRLRVELRTVNHRYFHATTRLPHALARWDNEIREWLRALFPRGAVSCTIRVEPDDAAAAAGLRIDDERVAAYLALFSELGERFDVPGTPSLDLLARYNDIFVRGEPDEVAAELGGEELRPVVEAAAQQAIRMREDEGRRLADDLEGRLAAIEPVLGRIEAWAPERIVAERDRLRAAVQELAEGVAIDDARLTQEIVLLAERWDVNEELVRFRSHIDLFRELLGSEAKEPVGKRLSFLVQEMNREANTIGSKANDARIAHAVVALKDEIERLREQVENVE